RGATRRTRTAATINWVIRICATRVGPTATTTAGRNQNDISGRGCRTQYRSQQDIYSNPYLLQRNRSVLCAASILILDESHGVFVKRGDDFATYYCRVSAF